MGFEALAKTLDGFAGSGIASGIAGDLILGSLFRLDSIQAGTHEIFTSRVFIKKILRP